jgi:hypothetical protein
MSLKYVAAGAGDDRFDDAVLFATGEDQHARSGREQSERFDRLHARHSGKLQIHQHDIRAHVDHEFDRVLPGCRLADELKSAAR